MRPTRLLALAFFLPGLCHAQIGVNAGLLADRFTIIQKQGSPYGGARGSITDQWGWSAGVQTVLGGGGDSTAVLIQLNYREIRFHTAGQYSAGPHSGHHDYFVRTSHLVLTASIDAEMGHGWSFRPGMQVGLPIGARYTGSEYGESYQSVVLDTHVDERDKGDPFSLRDLRLHALLAWHQGEDRWAGSFLVFGLAFGFESYLEGNWSKAKSLRFEMNYGIWLLRNGLRRAPKP